MTQENNPRMPAPDKWFDQFKEESSFLNRENVLSSFKHFDQDRDNAINLKEFVDIYTALFHHRSQTDRLSREQFFGLFWHYADQNNFEVFWKKTVKPTLFPHSALIIVDMQNDFIDGPMALKQYDAREDPIDAIPIINKLVDNVKFNLIVYTQDWHPAKHISFYEDCCGRELNAKTKARRSIDMYDVVEFKDGTEQTLMPRHCIEYTKGARFHSKLKVVQNRYRAIVIRKGTQVNTDSYSAFHDKNTDRNMSCTCLDYELKRRGITDLYVCGLATDGCVAATVFDGLKLNYRVSLIEDACKGANPVRIKSFKEMMCERGGIIVKSEEVNDMVTAADRKPKLAYATIIKNALTSFFDFIFV